VTGALEAPRLAPRTPPTRQPAELIRLDKLGKRFRLRRGWRETLRRPSGSSWVTAIRDLSCTVYQGELFGLVGANGAGKTTLFKLLATTIMPDSGSASVAGVDLIRQPAEVRRLVVPVVADERSLYWRLTGRENLALFARLHGTSGSSVRHRVEEVLGVVGLHETADRLVATLSSGTRQRLLIARALLARPRVLLLDEPTRSLDPVAARALRQFLREELCGRQGCTVLLATHSPEEAFELCGRVGVLNRGTLVAVGSPKALTADLGNRYRVWARSPVDPALSALAAPTPAAAPGDAAVSADGWVAVELEIPAGRGPAAAVLTDLVRRGVEVAGFEPLGPTLADLISAFGTGSGMAARHG
jgi:ABC-2 type transport system ATP-binding protein